LEAWLRSPAADPQAWAAGVAGWQKLGAGMVMLYPTYLITKFEDQIETLRRFKDAAGA
jgi:hypothetical protein